MPRSAMQTQLDYKTVEMMETYGGSFVKSLAAMLRTADHINFQKVKNTWPEYWNEYKRMALKGVDAIEADCPMCDQQFKVAIAPDAPIEAIEEAERQLMLKASIAGHNCKGL